MFKKNWNFQTLFFRVQLYELLRNAIVVNNLKQLIFIFYLNLFDDCLFINMHLFIFISQVHCTASAGRDLHNITQNDVSL